MTEGRQKSASSILFPYAKTTGALTVRVSVSYLPEQSSPADQRWFWSYHIRVENDGDQPVQLIARHWKIEDANGIVVEVSGEGVVGDMPVIPPGGDYDYVSGCPLEAESGSMEGHYKLVSADGSMITADIPAFKLELPVA
ncbi:Co2+/Mg2+ efflux protein ApaG [Sphingomicrobium clamense]|uniref:Co2+/Mg2+ efflux protein ApaG n=1 Tax=Sphingomicrobium clamense TaxID=2851013 RepID=A0ABS6V6W9_9SPHN|nr:Co2+/Mg2+ efflux protein ApaG [Sphingomicrobium sp. B8]MBW0145305.1 Co2+/Mg2+ efflux protein ApaG [Sphingomicrobium sp. B8]